ncbi:TerD family protein [Nocardia macrotermitis]|uniref:Stress response protein SCP2 n=1 Tax=Nocardia macrotermitis TaxID=2585198 RepID=A0A7K0DF01_9NOCA|nr:TerD family protein [Nocardia macrotermitis]MQY23872.1 Stress response protein SCP2 [Nocardia macrotermitis]
MPIPLRAENGAPLDNIAMGLGWDAAKWRLFGSRPADIDLNAAALLFSGDQMAEAVFHERLNSSDGAVRLHGDNLTGDGKGDDEIISIDLDRLPSRINGIALIVTCYTGQTFDKIRNGFCRLYDRESGTQFTWQTVLRGPHTGMIMGILLRAHDGWHYTEIGQGITADHPREAMPHLARYLS